MRVEPIAVASLLALSACTTARVPPPCPGAELFEACRPVDPALPTVERTALVFATYGRCVAAAEEFRRLTATADAPTKGHVLPDGSLP